MRHRYKTMITALLAAAYLWSGAEVAAQSITITEASTYACTEIDPAASLRSLEDVGWERVNSSQLTQMDRDLIATGYLIGPLLENEGKALSDVQINTSNARARQLISRVESGSVAIANVILKHPNSNSILVHYSSSRGSVKSSGCTIHVDSASKQFLETVAAQNDALANSPKTTLIFVGGTRKDQDRIETSVELFLWNDTISSVVLGRIAPSGGLIVSRSWKNTK